MSAACRVALSCWVLLVTASVLNADDKKEKEPPVSGLFKGNGIEAKLAYVSAMKGEPSLGKPTTVLIFTEKDHSKEKMPRNKAFFGDFGSALIITVREGGDINGCEVIHSAHKKSGFTDIGRIKTTDFKVADGKITGKITTEGELETFGEKWEVKLKFEVKAP